MFLSMKTVLSLTESLLMNKVLSVLPPGSWFKPRAKLCVLPVYLGRGKVHVHAFKLISLCCYSLSPISCIGIGRGMNYLTENVSESLTCLEIIDVTTPQGRKAEQ